MATSFPHVVRRLQYRTERRLIQRSSLVRGGLCPFRKPGGALETPDCSYLSCEIESTGFHPEMVYSANLGVNRRDRLCDVARHVSAQYLDFLDIDEISSFLNWRRVTSVCAQFLSKGLMDGHQLVFLDDQQEIFIAGR